MALRDQPYLPLYVQDFLTDEKLSQCSAKATGVYIRLLCLMHKSENYGKILLKQKNKQTSDNVKNFASILTKQMPYDFHTVTESLVELLDEKVLMMEGDILIQKRMVKDCAISEIRSLAGKTGGTKTQKKHSPFDKANAKAKIQANSEYENVIENGLGKEKEGVGEKEKDLAELEINQAIEFIDRITQKKLSPKDVINYWQAFLIGQAESSYFSRSKKTNHFRNWLKNQILKNGNRNAAEKEFSSIESVIKARAKHGND